MTDTGIARPSSRHSNRSRRSSCGSRINLESQYPNEHYTVAWICPRPFERKAAQVMLDEEHGRPQRTADGDENVYCLGSLHDHNIVIVGLPSGENGTESTAIVAEHLKFSFPKIDFGFLIGVAGAIFGDGSSNRDIRLGDVVVSVPDDEGNHSGVVEVWMLPDGQFTAKRTGFSKPSRKLRQAVGIVENGRVNRLLDDVIKEKLADSLQAFANYEFPGRGIEDGFDVLFDHSYEHPIDSQHKHCRAVCDWKNRSVSRSTRTRSIPYDEHTADGSEPQSIHSSTLEPDDNPRIHLGLVATGRLDIRNSSDRERVWQKTKALCMDNEAGGIAIQFSRYLIVRGICNYSDSHKNNRWERYAAFAAVAYASELLTVITPGARRRVRFDLSPHDIDTTNNTAESHEIGTSRIQAPGLITESEVMSHSDNRTPPSEDPFITARLSNFELAHGPHHVLHKVDKQIYVTITLDGAIQPFNPREQNPNFLLASGNETTDLADTTHLLTKIPVDDDPTLSLWIPSEDNQTQFQEYAFLSRQTPEEDTDFYMIGLNISCPEESTTDSADQSKGIPVLHFWVSYLGRLQNVRECLNVLDYSSIWDFQQLEVRGLGSSTIQSTGSVAAMFTWTKVQKFNPFQKHAPASVNGNCFENFHDSYFPKRTTFYEDTSRLFLNPEVKKPAIPTEMKTFDCQCLVGLWIVQLKCRMKFESRIKSKKATAFFAYIYAAERDETTYTEGYSRPTSETFKVKGRFLTRQMVPCSGDNMVALRPEFELTFFVNCLITDYRSEHPFTSSAASSPISFALGWAKPPKDTARKWTYSMFKGKVTNFEAREFEGETLSCPTRIALSGFGAMVKVGMHTPADCTSLLYRVEEPDDVWNRVEPKKPSWKERLGL